MRLLLLSEVLATILALFVTFGQVLQSLAKYLIEDFCCLI
jgi:hypothetical protein